MAEDVSYLNSNLNKEVNINNDWDFSVLDELKKAWEQVRGTKLAYWGGLVLFYLLFIGIGIVEGIIQLVIDDTSGLLVVALRVINLILQSIFFGGIALMSLKRARGEEINPKMIFSLFRDIPTTAKIAQALLFMSVLIAIGLILLLLPGIYLSIVYCFTIFLILDKDIKVWQAMETSRKVVTKIWFSYFLTFIAFSIILFISALPFGIGLIWTVPMGFNLWGNLYINNFDVP